MQSMVQQGAGMNDADPKFKFTPLHWAAHQGALEVRKSIDQNAPCHIINLASQICLHSILH